MVIFSLIREALAALWANRLRSGLTILGMVMGITSVITIVSTVEGMQKSIEDTFKALGANTFMVSRFGFNMTMDEYLERRRRQPLTKELIPRIVEGCPDCEHVGAETYASEHLKFEDQRLRWVEIRGETPNILDMQDIDVMLGRYITWEDEERRQPVAFIGHLVYERFFEGLDPIGQRLRIGQREFTVVGVAEKIDKGGIVSGFDEFVVIPISLHQQMYRKPGNPVNLVISSYDQASRELAIDQARVVLRTARRLDYEADDDFEIFTPDAILSFINDFTAAFRAILVSLPLLSIVVGGIVIMNIMMISVTERTREIGIRKSIGASRRAILVQFMWESIILSLIGGVIGILAGIKLGGMVLGLMDIEMTPTTLAIMLGFGISTAVGVFFGIYPALKAARLDPIEALSYE